jgi:hypothetical protein
MEALTLVSPDTPVMKTEIFDVEFARQLVDDKNLNKEERDKLRRYIKNSKYPSDNTFGMLHDTTYKLGKDCKHEFLGRLCALRGESLQGFSRQVRNALAQQFYWDLDFINAQPTLLKQYADKNGWKCDALTKYIETREELLTEICDTIGVERWEAKEKVIAICFGAGAGAVEGMPDFFVNEFYPEMRMIMKNNWDLNKKTLKFLEKQPNNIGRGLAQILQTEERTCLLALDISLGRRQRKMEVYIHDGGLVRKKDNETCFPSSLLLELEKDVERMTGYKLGLSVKAMKTTFVKINQDNEYAEMKVEFEKTHFKLMNPPSYVRQAGGQLQFMKEGDLSLLYQNVFCGDKLFISLWKSDPEIRTYEEVVFKPKQEVTTGQFNIFTDFSCKAVQGDCSVMNDLMWLLSGKEKEVYEYIENYFAHLIQKPYEKCGVCLVFSTSKQGAGKDTPLDFIGSILGSEYFFNTEDAENNVFGRFTSHLQKTLLLKMEEVEFETNKKNESALLSLITAPKRSYEAKGREPITLDDYKRIVMTTNKSVPVNVPDSDRRFVLINSSEDRVGDRAYWNRVHKELAKPETAQAYFHYLLNKDISQFDVRERPITEFYKEAKMTLRPSHAVYFQKWIALHGETMEECEMTASEMLTHMNENSKFLITAQKIGRELRVYPETAITKKKGMYSNSYTLHTKELHAFLVSKGWWSE